ncbi:CD82 antigen [Solea solea]|uniref:CD82 antigen n=1 Tax=Solea solea TaxID=90069 RepID=UPI00272AB490|nr:CD82 antigen [Solea solea]
MKLDLKVQLLKFCSLLLNFLLLALGLSVTGCGAWILFDRGNFLSHLASEELSAVAFSLLTVGCVVIAVSILGCVGTTTEHRLLLLVYLGFFIVLILGQLFVTLLLLINRNKIEDSVDTALDVLIFHFGNSSSSDDVLINNLQIHGRCCGRTGRSDWLKNTFINSLNLSEPHVLPCSCFNSFQSSTDSIWCLENLNLDVQQNLDFPQNLKATETPVFGKGNSSYEQGCKQALSDWLQENILTIVAMDISLMVLQVVQVAVVVSLYQTFGRKTSLKEANQLIDPDPTPSEDYQMIDDQNHSSVIQCTNLQ